MHIEEYKKKSLKPYHVLIATSLALFRRYGALNQGVVNISMKEVGRRLADIAVALMGGDVRGKSLPEAARLLNEMLDLNEELLVEESGGRLIVKSRSEKCKVCPRRVGELELPGSLCPYVGLFEGFLEELKGVELSVVDEKKPLEKVGEYCVIEYSVKSG